MKTEPGLNRSTFYHLVRSVLLLGFFVIGLCVFGQQDDKENLSKSMVIKFDVASFSGDWVTNSSGIGLGVEFGLSSKLSFEQDLTYLYKTDQGASNFSINVENLYGIKSNSELHFYFDESLSAKLNGLYWGPNFVFQYTNAKREEWLEDRTLNNYTINRYFTALNLKLGYQGELYKNLLIDVAMGIGVQNVSSNSDGKISESAGFSEFPFGKYYDEGSDWFIRPSFNLRLGYRF